MIKIAIFLTMLTSHGLGVPSNTVYHFGSCPSASITRSCTVPSTHDIYLSSHWNRRDLYHELGHQFDYWLLTPEDRMSFQTIMGDHRDWQSTPNSPHEQFAEAFALCGFDLKTLLKQGDGQILGGYDYRPTPSQYLQVCHLLKFASRDILPA
jgi:hypothetical protein